jgi:hypothetical protein
VNKLRTLAILTNPQSVATEISAAMPRGDADLRTLIHAAERQRLLPAVSRALRSNPAAAKFPDAIRDMLSAISFQTAAENAHYQHNAEEIVKVASEHHIDLAPIKGLHLLGRYYEIDERPMMDIDFLVRKHDASKILKMMTDLGYELNTGGLSDAFIIRYDTELKFHREGQGGEAHAEMRWDLPAGTPLKNAFPIDTEPIWQRAKHDDNRLWVLCPEDHILICAFHLSVLHAFARLAWVSDIHRITLNEKIDWDLIVRNAETGRITKAVYYPLLLARDYYASPIPQDILKRLKPALALPMSLIEKCMQGEGHIPEMGIVRSIISDKPAAFFASTFFPGLDYLASRHNVDKKEAIIMSIKRPFEFLMWNITGKT